MTDTLKFCIIIVGIWSALRFPCMDVRFLTKLSFHQLNSKKDELFTLYSAVEVKGAME